MRRSLSRVILFRIASAVPVLFGVLVATFLLVRALPGDPAVQYATSPGAGPAELSQIRHHLGLDLPLPVQFARYVAALARGDLGTSVQSGQPVAADLAERLPATLELAAAALVMALAVALPAGVLAGLRRDGAFDQACRAVTSVTAALPVFYCGLLLIYLFYYRLGIAAEPIGRWPLLHAPPPAVTGFATLDAALAGDGALFWATLGKLVLPAASMAVFALAPLQRIMRAATVAVLESDHFRGARAYGLSRRRLVWSYLLPNAMLPVLATVGMVLSTMIGANVLVEKLFAWPGIGSYAIDSLIALDYAPVQAYVLLVAALYTGMTLALDILSAVLDPRYRLEG